MALRNYVPKHIQMDAFAQRLSFLIWDLQCTPTQLAVGLGVHPSLILKYLKCQHFPSTPMLKRIADSLGVTTDWLLGNHTRKSCYKKQD
jgi:transcriptional regulator with XRE-family HTH domain